MTFWRGRRVFLTGHTGFKGSWLAQWLLLDGASVTGYSLPPAQPSLFADAKLAERMHSIEGDVRDLVALNAAIDEAKPEIVIHMAAQALVRRSYDDSVATYATNVMGTVHVLDAIRRANGVRVALIVTSDKCYENDHPDRPFREDDPLGGHDPYASSKACAELVTHAYRRSFFHDTRIATARAGNVIGGGDWAEDRLIPDLVRAFSAGETALIRNPHATRPWQFVLDALHGYRLLSEALWDRDDLPHAWNFGADESRPVSWLADAMATQWGGGAAWRAEGGEHPHEAPALALDSTRAKTTLGWRPLLDAESTVAWTTEFYKRRDDVNAILTEQLARFAELAR